MNSIYLDHCATTPVDQQVLNEMIPYLTEKYGNPSSIHKAGKQIRLEIEDARSEIAAFLSAKPSEIYFTSGGTEAINLALRGTVRKNYSGKNHIITTQTEHGAVLQTCRTLEKNGFSITYLKVNSHGMVNPEEIRRKINPKTCMVAVIHVNNETGTINPIREIGEICREKRIYFFSDAVQSFGKLVINVNDLNIDLLSASAHKINGPKGTGIFYAKRNVQFDKLIYGGNQENRKRAGTENVAGIIGTAKASQIAYNNLDNNKRKIGGLRDYFQDLLGETFSGITVHGHPRDRLYNILNVSFKGCEADALLTALDRDGIAVSTGAACSSGTLEPSHVLKAMGVKKELLKSSIRFSFGKSNSKEEVNFVLEKLKEIIPRLRRV